MVAFRYTEYPVRGTPIDNMKARLLDGTIPAASTLMICGSCGEPVNYADLVPVPGW